MKSFWSNMLFSTISLFLLFGLFVGSGAADIGTNAAIPPVCDYWTDSPPYTQHCTNNFLRFCWGPEVCTWEDPFFPSEEGCGCN